MIDTLPQDAHSAAYFGEQRNFWWNDDFVALLGQRLRLSGVRRVLDVGCGLGHWGRVLLPHMPEATLVGVDPEEAWVRGATERARQAGLGDRALYQRGEIHALPFEEAQFDLVTCQTVLIHVADVRRALADMKRVLAPGGLLVTAEPNNLASALAEGSARRLADPDTRAALLRFQMICERGKVACGEGDNSLGEVLIGLIAEAGFTEPQCWISDRAQTLVPPYKNPDQRAFRDDMIAQYEKGNWIWSRDETQRYFLAGGGTASEFEEEWARARTSQKIDVDALLSETFVGAGGSLFYVIAARKSR